MTTPSSTATFADLRSATRRPLLDRGVRPAWWTFLGAQAGSVVFYLWFGRHQWFFFDEWDFLAGRGLRVDDLLSPHVAHWTTIPLLVYRAMWALFGLHSYLPYQLLAVMNHAIVAGLLRWVMRRAGVGPWLATIAATAFLFYGAGNQNVLWAFQIAFTLALIFGLSQLLLADHDGPICRRDWWGLAAGVAAIASSGVGPPLVVAVGAACLVRRGWRAAAFHTVPLLVIYAAWWLSLGRFGDDPYGHASPLEVVRWVWSGSWAALEQVAGSAIIGLALVGVLASGLSIAWRHLGRPTVRCQAAAPVGLLAAAVAFLAVTGWGRGGGAALGYEKSNRYLYIVLALLLPALGIAAQALYERWHWSGVVLVPLLLVGMPHGVRLTVDYFRVPEGNPQAVALADRFLGRDIRPTLLALPHRPLAHEAPRDLVPFPDRTPYITFGWLLEAARDDRLPQPPADEVVDRRADLVLSMMQVDRSLESGVCRTVTAPERVHLAPPTTLRLDGGPLDVVSAGDESHAQAHVVFDRVFGRTIDVLAPVDVVLSSASPAAPAVVCSS